MKRHLARLDEQKNPIVYKIADYERETFGVNGKVDHIGIYRDHVKWSYKGDRWDITTDVALKLTGSGFSFLFVLPDALDKAILVLYDVKTDDHVLIDHEWSKTHWGLKAENADSLERYSRNTIKVAG